MMTAGDGNRRPRQDRDGVSGIAASAMNAQLTFTAKGRAEGDLDVPGIFDIVSQPTPIDVTVTKAN